MHELVFVAKCNVIVEMLIVKYNMKMAENQELNLPLWTLWNGLFVYWKSIFWPPDRQPNNR